MIRIFSDMDRYIQDYKIQRQMAENKKSIQPLSDIAKTKDFTNHNDSSLHQNLNTTWHLHRLLYDNINFYSCIQDIVLLIF